ncbi:MAG TPA: dehydrogenase, partial [Eubacteriaceae bacterium]|nr:dehydrogenase [Eubacteriaceae bacterium]
MKNINLCTVGYGGIAKVHLAGLHMLQTGHGSGQYHPQVKTVVSGKPNLAIPGVQKVTDQLDQALSDPEIDGIDLCTPNFLHARQTKEVLITGKSIYLEKPLANTIEEAKELADLSNAFTGIHQCALMYRFLPSVIAARDAIRQGAIGDILHFRFALYHKGYLDENRPMSWRLDKEQAGGGALVDLGIHMFDTLRFLLGEANELMAQTNIYFKERYTDSNRTEKTEATVDEWALVHLNMENGARGTVEVSRITSDLNEDTIIEIFGSKGSIKIHSDDFTKIRHYDHVRKVLETYLPEPASEFAAYHQTFY